MAILAKTDLPDEPGSPRRRRRRRDIKVDNRRNGRLKVRMVPVQRLTAKFFELTPLAAICLSQFPILDAKPL